MFVFRRGRARATWLLALVLTSACLGVCTAMLHGLDGKPPCCVDLGPGHASFTACCGTGEQSAFSQAAIAVPVPPPPAPAVPFAAIREPAADAVVWRRPHRDIAFRPPDRQSLLSTFLI